MTEARFWSQLRTKILQVRPTAVLMRVESGSTASGIPDVNYLVDGYEGWIELKVAKVTRNGPVVTNLRPAQANWLYRRQANGGRAWLLAGVKPPWVKAGNLILVPGLLAPELLKAKGSLNNMLAVYPKHVLIYPGDEAGVAEMLNTLLGG